MSVNKIILILILAAGGYFWWHKADQKKRYEAQVESLASILDRKWLARETPEKEVTTKYLQAILEIDGYRDLFAAGKLKIPVSEYVKDAVSRTGPPSGEETDLIVKSLLESHGVCERGKILDDSAQVRGMNEGTLPVLQAGSYKGEHLLLTRKIPVQFSRQSLNHPANLALTPESVYAQIWPLTASDSLLKTADEFNRVRLIESGEFMDIKRLNDQLGTLKFR